MNSLKTLSMVAVLLAVGYGAYVTITRPPSASDSPSTAPAWPGDPPSGSTSTSASASGSTGGGLGIQMPGVPSAPPENVVGGHGAAGAPGAKAAWDPAAQPMPGGNPVSPVAGGAAPGGPSVVLGGSAATGARNDPFRDPPAYTAPPYPPVGSAVPAADARFDSSLSWPPASAMSAPAGPPSGQPATTDGALQATFRSIMQDIQTMLDAGRLAEAQLALSNIHEKDGLPEPMRDEVIGLLDQLAGTVIYSRQHLLELPYRVQPGETLEQIAAHYNVPWELLARINGLSNPADLRPGQELKVVRGPFGALIRLDRFELTLILHGRYAGRFPIGVGSDAQALQGTFTVREKIVNPAYYGPDGVNVHPDDPNNPLGDYLLDLDGVAIHGTNEPNNLGRHAGRGCIFLSPRDIDDVFHILSVGSRVIIEP